MWINSNFFFYLSIFFYPDILFLLFHQFFLRLENTLAVLIFLGTQKFFLSDPQRSVNN
jgi:hypothetical protein